jgi:hypothetical protein
MSQDFPKGWTKTVEDLVAEKRDLSGEEIAWARSYEREQLRSWARFPRPGEVYELCVDAQITYLIHWLAPFTGGGKGMLPKGARVRVAQVISEAEPISVGAEPLEKAQVEAVLIPESERNDEKYGGFSLSIRTAELNKLFRLVEDEKPVRG